MHIVQVITELAPAGAERVLTNLSIGLKEKGHEVTVISLKSLPENRTIVNELFEHDIPILSLHLTKLTPWRIFKLSKLLSFIKRQLPDDNQLVVHSHLMHANLICRFNKMYNNSFKLLNTIHIAEKRKHKLKYFILDRLTIKFCDHINAVSKAARNYHAAKLNVESSLISIVCNGINPPVELSDSQVRELKNSWGLSGCNKIIGSTGRLDRQKGYDIIFKLLPELSHYIPDGDTWGVVIIGEGNQRALLEKLALKVPENIRIALPGFRADAASCITAFDLFIMPSRYEGFGLTLIEAMAHGIPVVAGNVDSLPEIMYNYSNGKCVAFDDPEEAIQSLVNYLNKPKSAAKFNYTVEKMTDGYLHLYLKICANKQMDKGAK